MNRNTTRAVRALALSLVVVLAAAAPALAQEGQETYNIEVVQVDTSQFPRVEVWVSVTDAQGNPVRTLPASAFTLFENGQPVEASEVHQAGEQGPVTVVLVLDRSGSMNDLNKLEEAKAAATAFVDLMRPEDATGLVVFNTQVEVVQPITNDQAALREAIAGVQAVSDTAMYDALGGSMDLLSGVQGRKAVIILSDGLDNRSQLSEDDILSRVEQAEVSIYTIGLGDPAVGTADTAGIDEAALQAIADRSRGIYLYAPEPDSLSGLYEQLSSRLQNEYRLSYISPNALHDGVERGVEVRVAETASAVQTGYNPGGIIPETAQALSWPIFGGLLAGLVLLLLVPDVVRRIGQGGGTIGFGNGRKKGRVRLTQAQSPAALKKAKGAQPTSSRVRLRD